MVLLNVANVITYYVSDEFLSVVVDIDAHILILTDNWGEASCAIDNALVTEHPTTAVSARLPRYRCQQVPHGVSMSTELTLVNKTRSLSVTLLSRMMLNLYKEAYLRTESTIRLTTMVVAPAPSETLDEYSTVNGSQICSASSRLL